MEPYLGQISAFAFAQDREIHAWLICDGRTLDIERHASLFSLLGSKYGGDGVSTFAIPDLREVAQANNVVYQICVSGTYPTFQ